MERLRKIKKMIEKKNWELDPPSIKKRIDEFLNFIEHPELSKKSELIDKMITAYEKAMERNFQFEDDLEEILMVLRIKLPAAKPSPESIMDDSEVKMSTRLRWAVTDLRAKLGDDENIDEIISALMKMPLAYRPGIEGMLYMRSKEESPDVLKKEVGILAPFLKTLSGIDPKDITTALRTSKYTTISDMVKHMFEEAKAGREHVLDSEEKLMQYFFPKNEVKLTEVMLPIEVLANYFEDPMSIPGAQEVKDMWDGLVNFAAVVKCALTENLEDPSFSIIFHEISNILKSLSYGDITIMYNIRLKKAAERGNREEVEATLKNIKNHIRNNFIEKINTDIIPELAKAGLGEKIRTFQEDIIKNIGINIGGLKWKRGIDDTFYRAKARNMHEKFDRNIDKIKKYLNEKAKEEITTEANVGNRVQILNKFFQELKWGWKHAPTPNELPLLNAICVLILEKVKKARRHVDDIIKVLAKIFGKSLQSAMNISITSGLKSEEHPTSKPVREFIKNMEDRMKELSELRRLNETLATISANMRVVNKNLPFEFIQNAVFMKNPDEFLSHLSKYEKKVNFNQQSSLITEEEYKKRMTAVSNIKKEVEELKKFRKELRQRVKLPEEPVIPS